MRKGIVVSLFCAIIGDIIGGIFTPAGMDLASLAA